MTAALCELTLTIPRDLANLHMATDIALWICRQVYKPPLQEDLTFAVELCVSEACTNAMKHAVTTAAEDVLIIGFVAWPDRLVIVVKDQGPGYDISKVPLPDFNQHPEGGYGIYIIKSMMDVIQYYQEGGFNHLKMTKFLAETARGSIP